MPELLFELFSEEIPARMQRQAANDLERLVTTALTERGLTFQGAVAHATPRRLALHVAGLPARQPDLREEKKGPRVGAPEAAIQGFLKSAGLTSLDRARIVKDEKKGEFYVAALQHPGKPTLEVLAEILPAVIRSFPWPKSMRWGAASIAGDSLRWVRPLHSIVATFGTENEDPEIVPFAVDGIAAGDITYGHRFLKPDPIKVRRFEDYQEALERAFVVLSAERRKNIILHDARELAFAQGFELVEDEGLLEETAGLVEWPRVLMGAFDPAFLAVPAEAIRATIRANQKCFVLKSGAALTNRFILVSNNAASDGGREIIAGNERVVAARLSDAKFFWDADLKVKLTERLAKLDKVVFHERLGTQGERVERIVALAHEIAPQIDANAKKTALAAHLAKADLMTEMVGEFPELQGVMGRYYALAQGEDADVAAAVEEHYKPQGPGDRTPTNRVAIAVALADKIDTLVGFWAIGEKPTGSKDPYALRRAALGVIRLILENNLRLRLLPNFRMAQSRIHLHANCAQDLLGFFAERLKIYLREKGVRHDLIDAVFALDDQDDLPLAIARIEALGAFLETEDGKNLLAGYKRAANILRAEEKKDFPGAFDEPHAPEIRSAQQEHDLATVLDVVRAEMQAPLKAEDFAGAMRALAKLRAPVDAFFDGVIVNADDPRLRLNRLQLLNELRNAMHGVADFSKIAG